MSAQTPDQRQQKEELLAYLRACNDLCDQLRAASDAGLSGREIDQVYIDGMHDLGAKDGEIVTWMGIARQ